MPYQELHVEPASGDMLWDASAYVREPEEAPRKTGERGLIWTVGLTGIAAAALTVIISVV